MEMRNMLAMDPVSLTPMIAPRCCQTKWKWMARRKSSDNDMRIPDVCSPTGCGQSPRLGSNGGEGESSGHTPVLRRSPSAWRRIERPLREDFRRLCAKVAYSKNRKV
jgi:hypothetical protein